MEHTFPRIDVHPVDHCNLACIGCNHAAPFQPKTVHDVHDYRRWLDLIREHGHSWEVLGISGGEPFLHPEINVFCRVLRAAYPDCIIEIFSNMFWLRDAAALRRYAIALQSVNRLMASHYPSVVERIGWEHLLRAEEEIRRRFGIEVGSFQEGIVHGFAQVEFYEEARPVTDAHDCAIKDCTQLRPDGLLYRCTYGHYLDTDFPSAGFRHPDLWYDLKRDFGARDLKAWRSRWPLGSCHFCGCGAGRQTWTNWVSDPSIRGLNKVEYQERLRVLVEDGR
jgi:4Fe-4S single cluster domain